MCPQSKGKAPGEEQPDSCPWQGYPEMRLGRKGTAPVKGQHLLSPNSSPKPAGLGACSSGSKALAVSSIRCARWSELLLWVLEGLKSSCRLAQNHGMAISLCSELRQNAAAVPSLRSGAGILTYHRNNCSKMYLHVFNIIDPFHKNQFSQSERFLTVFRFLLFFLIQTF